MGSPKKGLTLGLKVGESVFIDEGRIKVTLVDKPGRQFARLRINADEHVNIFSSGDKGNGLPDQLPRPPKP